MRVLAVSPGRKRAVFNLTVEPSHVYFAGGVLVSNCDATRMMGVWWRDHVGYEQSSSLERRPDPTWGPKSYGVRLKHAEVLGNTAKRIYRGKTWRNGKLVDAPPRPGDSSWRVI